MSKKVDTASQFIYSLQFSFGYNSLVCTWSAPSPQEMFQKTGLRSISKLLTLLCHDLWFMLHLWNFFKIIYSSVNYYLSSFSGFCESGFLGRHPLIIWSMYVEALLFCFREFKYFLCILGRFWRTFGDLNQWKISFNRIGQLGHWMCQRTPARCLHKHR